MAMTAPDKRFRAELDNADAPSHWWVLDAENPDIIRAQFPIQPDDVRTAEELAQEAALTLNAHHNAQVRSRREIDQIIAWVRQLDGESRIALHGAIKDNPHFYPMVQAVYKEVYGR